MRFLRTFMLTLATLVALVGVAPAATPAERAKARETFRAAQQHYKLTEYQQALEAFKETYRLVEDPTLLFNIAQCYRQLNKKEEAIRFYRTYLHDAPDDGNRASVEQIIASLEKAIHEENVARATPPDTTIDGSQPRPVTAPPPATVTSPPAQPVTQPVVVASTASDRPPLYKRWWLWTLVGGAVVVGAGVGLALGLTHQPGAPTASTQDGTFHPF
jgi:tetratricopeptide (TPR) repeat protein